MYDVWSLSIILLSGIFCQEKIIEAGKELGEIISLQLTENLREDLNPID